MIARNWRSFEEYTQAFLERYALPGLAIAVAHRGEVIYARGFGYRDREEQLPATPGTVFGIGSVTKSLTALALLQLEERGLLSVNDPVTRFLPEFRLKRNETATRNMTIHHFLTHSSGLPPLPSLIFAMADSLAADRSLAIYSEQAVKSLATHPPIRSYADLMAFIGDRDFELLGRPGQYFSYSNDAYGLLGAIIERASGRPYPEYIEENILRPAGMRSSAFDLTRLPPATPITSLYVKKPGNQEGVIAAPGWWEGPSMLAAGFLRSTVLDLVRYLEIFRLGGRVGDVRLLSESTVQRMATPFQDSGMGCDYGYGLMLTGNYHGHTLIEHGGGIKGVSAYVSCAPQADFTAAVLTNLGGVPALRVLTAAFNFLLGLPLTERRQPVRDYRYPKEHLERLAGTFPSGEGLSPALRVIAGENGLEAQLEPACHPIRLIGPFRGIVEMYGALDEGSHITFLRDDRDEVFAAHLGARMLLKRA